MVTQYENIIDNKSLWRQSLERHALKILGTRRKLFEIEDLPKLGWINITFVGEENMYFEYKNDLSHVLKGFVKI